MDDPLLLNVLVEQAKKVDLDETIEWIEENWYSEEERRERAEREQQQQAKNQSTDNTRKNEAGTVPDTHNSARRKKKKKERRDKGLRKSVYAPVGQEGEEPTLRGGWGDAAWFGNLGTVAAAAEDPPMG